MSNGLHEWKPFKDACRAICHDFQPSQDSDTVSVPLLLHEIFKFASQTISSDDLTLMNETAFVLNTDVAEATEECVAETFGSIDGLPELLSLRMNFVLGLLSEIIGLHHRFAGRNVATEIA